MTDNEKLQELLSNKIITLKEELLPFDLEVINNKGNSIMVGGEMHDIIDYYLWKRSDGLMTIDNFNAIKTIFTLLRGGWYREIQLEDFSDNIFQK